MIDASFRPAPTQNAVAQDELHPLGFTLQSAVQLVQRLKYLHGRACRLFVVGPFIPLQLPAPKNLGPDWVGGKAYPCFICFTGFPWDRELRAYFMASRFPGWIFPTLFQPEGNLFGRIWRRT